MTDSFGLLDTAVVIDLREIPKYLLPEQFLISAITLAELTLGTVDIDDPRIRSVREERIKIVEDTCEIVQFDRNCAHAFELIASAVVAYGRKPRGKRALDYFIATTAAHYKVPLYTRNPKDFEGLNGLVEIVSV